MNNKKLTKDAPFFIVGCGRSGTTLLRTLLNAHPRLAVPLESLFIADYLRVSDDKINTLKSLALHEYEIAEWGIKLSKSRLKESKTVAQLIDSIHSVYAKKYGKQRWGQKTPRLVRYWPEINAAFPSAKYIHVVRDPRPAVASLIKSNVHRSTTFYATNRWIKDIGYGLNLEQELPGHTLRVTYEDLVSDPTKTLVKICNFLGEEFDESMFASTKIAGKEYSKYYKQIHQKLFEKPDPKRINAWRKELKPWQIAFIEKRCGNKMKQLGYKKVNPKAYFLWPRAAFSYLIRWPKIIKQFLQYAIYRPNYISSYLRRKIALRRFRDIVAVNQ